jgi:PIN domain nuclease of toxin-antitoxin system
VIVLDTHTWLWWVDAPRRLSRRAARAIERADRIGVSTLTVFELVDLAEKRRIQLDAPVRTWIREALARSGVETLPLTPEIAIDAAQLRFASDPFDRIIYATARAEDAQLVTRDERLRALDPERTVW